MDDKELYGIDNEKQMVYVYHLAETTLELLGEYIFDEFFDCGHSK